MIDTIKIDIITEKVPDSFNFNMIKIAEGSFIMGDNNSQYEDEKPAHEVSLPAFYISQYPVTNIEYAIFLNDIGFTEIVLADEKKHTFIFAHKWGVQQANDFWQPSKGFEQHPIINISWYGAVVYCKWLNKKTDKNYRLPSEAEWEFAARGSNNGKSFPYAGNNKLKEVGWFRKNSYMETKRVGLKLPNELGIYDMSGNVWEWCADNWQTDYKHAPNVGSVLSSDKDNIRRTVRGGSWVNDDFDCKVSSRVRYSANYGNFNIGFRFARY